MQIKILARWTIVYIAVLVIAAACIEQSPSPEADPPTPLSHPDRQIADTIILYTSVESVTNTSGLTGTEPTASQAEYWALKVWPYHPLFDRPVFDIFYGEVAAAQGIARYFSNFRPQVSPNGRYLILPGIGGYTNPNGDLGTGLWVADLQAETVWQLLPQAKVITWSPDSEHISYVDNGTLYTLAIDEEAAPEALFTHPALSNLYAHWSPDGQWIAVVTMTPGHVEEPGAPELTNTYWLVAVNGEPAQELAVKQDFAMEYTTAEMAWSPDGQFLLMRNEIFDLTGAKVGTSFPGRVGWLPNQAQLLINGNEGIRLITVAGDEVARINSDYATAWAFSQDGQHLAYTQPADEDETNIFIYHLKTSANQLIASVPASSVFPLYWSGHDTHLIMGGEKDDHPFIWALDLRLSNVVEGFTLVERSILIEVVGDRTTPSQASLTQ